MVRCLACICRADGRLQFGLAVVGSPRPGEEFVAAAVSPLAIIVEVDLGLVWLEAFWAGQLIGDVADNHRVGLLVEVPIYRSFGCESHIIAQGDLW